jgi:hypothetical protein
MTEMSSSELRTGFDKLRKDPYFQVYTDALQGEFNRVQTALIQNAMSEEKELRVCTALLNAFQTALNLPDTIVQRVEADEELGEYKDG